MVIEAAIAMPHELGPGLLETVYEVILARELSDRMKTGVTRCVKGLEE